MALTPLHFPTLTNPTQPIGHQHRVLRGHREYHTDCDRFCVFYNEGRWRLSSTGRAWYNWLSAQGLFSADFKTRREAIDALESALEADDVVEAEHPPILV